MPSLSFLLYRVFLMNEASSERIFFSLTVHRLLNAVWSLHAPFLFLKLVCSRSATVNLETALLSARDLQQ